jgi:predicted nucleic acid-binding Zn ribbon protein
MDQNLGRACPVCGEAIPPRIHGGGRPKLFCSEKCRKKQAEAKRYQRHKDRISEQTKGYRLANIDRIRERNRRHQKANREKYAEATRRYARRHPERAKASYQRWCEANPDAVAKRRAMRATASPPWLTDAQKLEIKSVYLECRRLTQETGVQHHVDHIHPLSGQTSCGLHVPWNLQILTAAENFAKSNKLPEAA